MEQPGKAKNQFNKILKEINAILEIE